MLNNTSKNKTIVYARSLINGFVNFLQTNTGEIVDPTRQRYIINNQHIISATKQTDDTIAQQNQPTNIAKSADQALLIIGLIQAYIGYKPTNPQLLALAEKYWNAYVQYFYNSSVPSSKTLQVANKIINGKQPILANYPPSNNEYSSQGGFKCVDVLFENGVGQINTGAPNWGEFIDKVTVVFDGALSKQSIDGQPIETVNDIPQYDKTANVYQIDSFVDRMRRSVHASGAIIATNMNFSEQGKIYLVDRTVNGWHKVNYATRNDDQNYGSYIERNQCQITQPINEPITDQQYYTNDILAEQYFCEACYLLYKLTNDDKYYNAQQCVRYTLDNQLAKVDSDKFFYKTTKYDTPFVRGAQFASTSVVPEDVSIAIERNKSTGLIHVSSNKPGRHSISEFGCKCGVTSSSILNIEYGCDSISTFEAECIINDQSYTMPLPSTEGVTVTQSIPLSNLFVLDQSLRAIPGYYRYFKPYNSCYVQTTVEDISDNITQCPVSRITFARDDYCGCVFKPDYVTDDTKFSLSSIIYKSTHSVVVTATDSNKWIWRCNMPATNGRFITFSFVNASQYLQNQQPDHITDLRPAKPVGIDKVNQFKVELQENIYASQATRMWVYALNGEPARFTSATAVPMTKLTLTCNNSTNVFDYTVGDCYVSNRVTKRLKYVPGVFGSADVTTDVNNVKDDWVDIVNIDQQYPSQQLYSTSIPSTNITNAAKLFVESQTAFKKAFGTTGPVMSSYIWDHPYNQSVGELMTWINDVDNPDRQCFANALWNACNFALALKQRNRSIPTNLKTFITNALTFIHNFRNAHQKIPSEQYSDGIIEGDQYSCVANALYLGSMCAAQLAGITYNYYRSDIEWLFALLSKNYIVLDPGNYFNGGWSENPNISSGVGPENNGTFKGNYPGSILIGIAMYLRQKWNILMSLT